MKSFQLPDIDYSDPQQVLANQQLLFDLKSIAIDFSQEFIDPSGLMGKGDTVAVRNKYNEKAIAQANEIFGTAQNIAGEFINAYTHTQKETAIR